jgi:hypothetical protein
MKKGKAETDELRPEYRLEDFRQLERGKYAKRVSEASNVVVLDPEVARAFPNAQAVNDALRGLLALARASVKPAPGAAPRETTLD